MPFSLLDSLDSDTDCLVQEKAYQLELQNRITNNAQIVERNVHIQENTDLNRENCIYDSLEVTPATVVDDQITRIDEVTSDDSDEYADLRYDPDWRKNFEEARLFHELRTRLSLEPGIYDAAEGSDENLGQLQSLMRNGIDHRVVQSDRSAEAHVTVEKLSSVQADIHTSSFHLHPPEHQGAFSSSSLTSSQAQSPPASVTSAGGGHLNYSPKETRLSKPQRRQHNRAIPEWHDQTHEPRDQSDEATDRVKDVFAPSQKNCSHRWSNARPGKPRMDVVEQNKVTLGVTQSKQGSYLRRYGKRRDQPEQTDEVQESAEDSSTARQASQEDERPLDTEHLWHQRTQRLKVTQVIQGNRPQRKGGNDKPPRQEQHNRTLTRNRLSHLPARPLTTKDTHPLAEILVIDGASSTSSSNTSDSSPPLPPLAEAAATVAAPRARQIRRSPPPGPLPSSGRTPMVNLNINLNTSSIRDLSPHTTREQQQQPQQGGLLTLVSPRAPSWLVHPHVYPVPLPDSGSSPGLLSPPPPHTAGLGQWAMLMASPSAPAPHAGQQGLDFLAPPGGPPLWGLNSERVAVWQPTADWAPKPAAQPRDPSLTSSHSTGSSGPYAVLPPIGRIVAEESGRVACGASNGTATLSPRSCSDGYLAQLEKQRQTKTQAGYKAYTLKDYKILKQNIKLGGLGPSSTVTEMTAEKIRRQKLYSDVIRQHNRKISRIPFLPAQDLERTNKDAAPRRKALEYARTIAKPKVLPRPNKEAQKRQAGTGAQALVQVQTRYLSGGDVGHLTLLESLRQRHEQEKQAVAQFKAVHAI